MHGCMHAHSHVCVPPSMDQLPVCLPGWLASWLTWRTSSAWRVKEREMMSTLFLTPHVEMKVLSSGARVGRSMATWQKREWGERRRRTG